MERTYLTRVRLNAGGYDRSGTYFGRGKPLYKVNGPAVPHSSGVVYIRAWDRSDARDQYLKVDPTAKIRR